MAATMKLDSVAKWGLSILIALCTSAGLARAQATQPQGGYQPTAFPESYHGGVFPAAEFRALPGARAAAVAAEADLRRAQTELSTTVADLRHSFSRSTELNQAQAEERAAWAAFEAARDHALAQLENDETYKAAVELRNRTGAQIQEQRDQSTVEHMLTMATVKLSFAASTSAMEAASIASDPQVQAARERLLAVGKHLAELNAQFDDAVRGSPQVVQARRQVEDAKIAALATDAAYIEATRVARTALDFSYHIYDYPYPYVVNTPYYSTGYGYGSTAVGYPIGYPFNWQAHR
jgi:hypothetical protein